MKPLDRFDFIILRKLSHLQFDYAIPLHCQLEMNNFTSSKELVFASKNLDTKQIMLPKSLVYNKNRTGSKIDPWGTPILNQNNQILLGTKHCHLKTWHIYFFRPSINEP